MLYFLAAAVLVALDQLSKLAVRSSLALGQHITLLPGVLGLTYVQNTGMAFSSLSGKTVFLTIVSLAASIVLCILLAANRPFTHPFGKWTLALLLAPLTFINHGRGVDFLHYLMGCVATLVMMAVFYMNYLWLTPRYFVPGRHRYYFIINIIVIITLGIGLHLWMDYTRQLFHPDQHSCLGGLNRRG